MKNICFCFYTFLFLYWRTCDSFFPKIPGFLTKNINIDVTIPIPIHQLSIVDRNTIQKITGFYGLLGPYNGYNKTGSLYELFLSDGIIQGMFFQNGNLTFIKHLIRTEKVKLEENLGARFTMTPILRFIFMILHDVGIMPNMLGVANTALMHHFNKTYALFEYDKPYLIDINTEISTVNTIKYMNELPRFSAHSKYSGSVIETIDYDSLKKQIVYYQFMQPRFSTSYIKSNLTINKKHYIKTNYIPVTHDFISMNQSILIMDSPLVLSINKMPPIFLDTNKPTYFYLLDKTYGYYNVYYYNEGLYLFHYSQYRENLDTLEFYGSFYDTIDFSKYDIQGKYRKIIINKKTNNVTLIKNDILENLNLDFPMKIDDKHIILIEIKNSKMVGFVILQDFTILKQISLKDKYICGEPRIIMIEKLPYFLCFLTDINDTGSLFLMNLKSFYKIEIHIPNTKMHIGFHSIFI